MDIKLKPCPFCGNKHPNAIRYYDLGKECGSNIVCSDCGAVFNHIEACSIEENIEAWNRRPGPKRIRTPEDRRPPMQIRED